MNDRSTNSPVQRAALRLLRSAGWQDVFTPLPAAKGLIVVYPHTSNWDFIIGVLYKLGIGLPAHWIAKDTLFRGPLGWLFRRLGGIPVNRRERTGFVEALLAEFERSEALWVAVAPEGTRSRVDHWKSGFYRIAVAGQFPVGLGYIDYATRTVGIDTYVSMTGDVQQDMARIRDFYAGKRGRVPQKAGDIRLRG